MTFMRLPWVVLVERVRERFYRACRSRQSSCYLISTTMRSKLEVSICSTECSLLFSSYFIN